MVANGELCCGHCTTVNANNQTYIHEHLYSNQAHRSPVPQISIMQSAALRKNSSFSYSHCIYFQQSLHNFLSTLSFSMRFFILLFLFCFSLTYSVSLAIILCLFHFETSNLLLSQIFIALCCLCSFCTTDPILLQLIF